MATTETFRLDDADGSIYRESDDELVATLQSDGDVVFTHPAREKAYGKAVKALIADKAPPADTPNFEPAHKPIPAAEPKAPKDAPPRDLQAGAYSPAWLLYDHATLDDKAFANKWKRLELSVIRNFKDRPDTYGTNAIKEITARLDKIPSK